MIDRAIFIYYVQNRLNHHNDLINSEYSKLKLLYFSTITITFVQYPFSYKRCTENLLKYLKI